MKRTNSGLYDRTTFIPKEVRSPAAPCESSPSSSSRVPFARSWLTWLLEEAGRAARPRQLSQIRAPCPHEPRRKGLGNFMAELYASHALPRYVGSDREMARGAPPPDRASCPRFQPFSARQGTRRAILTWGPKAPGYRGRPDPLQPRKESPSPRRRSFTRERGEPWPIVPRAFVPY